MPTSGTVSISPMKRRDEVLVGLLLLAARS